MSPGWYLGFLEVNGPSYKLSALNFRDRHLLKQNHS